jgi:hypothetical protein
VIVCASPLVSDVNDTTTQRNDRVARIAGGNNSKAEPFERVGELITLPVPLVEVDFFQTA